MSAAMHFASADSGDGIYAHLAEELAFGFSHKSVARAYDFLHGFNTLRANRQCSDGLRSAQAIYLGYAQLAG
jgi:hypothetical protein